MEKLPGEVVSRPLETSNGTLTQLHCVKARQVVTASSRCHDHERLQIGLGD